MNYHAISGGSNLGSVFGAADLIGQREIIFGLANSPQGASMMQEALQQRNAVMLTDVEPTKSRRYPLGFPTTTISASSTGVVSAQPQIPFRGERLVVPSDFAGDLLITDIKVGKNSQLAAANPLPARAFTEYGWGIDLHLDTADISQFVTLNLSNTSAADISFNALLIGRAVE